MRRHDGAGMAYPLGLTWLRWRRCAGIGSGLASRPRLLEAQVGGSSSPIVMKVHRSRAGLQDRRASV